MKGGIDAMSCVTMEASPTRYDEDSVKKRQTSSLEVASVLLDAHAADQKENILGENILELKNIL